MVELVKRIVCIRRLDLFGFFRVIIIEFYVRRVV